MEHAYWPLRVRETDRAGGRATANVLLGKVSPPGESGCEEDGPGLFTGSGDGSIAFWRRDERRMLPVYFLYVDLGKDLDVEHLKFLSGRVTPTPLGPFQFLHI